jgi:hypothetical protein
MEDRMPLRVASELSALGCPLGQETDDLSRLPFGLFIDHFEAVLKPVLRNT